MQRGSESAATKGEELDLAALESNARALFDELDLERCLLLRLS